ncbi:MAG TPA: EAL domain-containing protein [Acidimicrobiales bacterium]|nr:EAL domain-containing protein [Acidimicrobiales bacterium]
MTDRLLEPLAIIDSDSSLRYANAAAAAFFDVEPHQLVGLKMIDLVHPHDRDRVARQLSEIVGDEPEAGFTQFRLRGDSSLSWHTIDCYAHNLSDEPDIGGILISASDVSSRERLARALQTLSECNDVLVHASDEASLIANICRSIVHASEYMLAWVGYVEHDADQSVRFVAAHGATEFLDGLRVSWGDNEFGHGATGEAIRSGTTHVIKDIRRAKRCLAWRERIEEQGARAVCSFPLIVNGTTIGALSIYSREYGSFDDAEVELLSKLADNLAYGIARIRDAELLKGKEAHLREAERLAQMGHWEWELQSDQFTFLADEMYGIVGIDPHQWKGTYQDFLATIDPVDLPFVEAAFNEALRSGKTEVLYKISRPDGEPRWARMHAESVLDARGLPERVVGITLDITSYIAAKQELAHSRQFLLAITDNMTEGMIATDESGTITFANAAAGRLLGSDATELIDGLVLEYFRVRRENGQAEDAARQLSAVWTRGDSMSVEYDVLVRRDGSTFPISYNATPLRDEGLRGCVIVFEDITDRAAAQLRVEQELEKLTWVGRIRDALDNGSFVLYAQPIVDLATRAVLQHELLIRMVSGDGEIIAPESFLPAAEEYGLITEIDRWVVGETARLAGLGHAVEFNLSAKSVADPGMLSRIASAIEEFGAPASNIVCEITETALVRELGAAEEFVRGLNDLGIKVALDDFGAGYGGFAYLKRLPVSYLKIDREFVSDLVEEVSSQHVVSAVVSLAKAFGMHTIAEGAEDERTVRLLEELGVDHVQGFVFGRPEPISSVFGRDTDQSSRF